MNSRNMFYQFFKITLVFLFALIIQGCCNCRESTKCPSIPKFQRNLISEVEGDSIVFISNLNDRMVFHVYSSYIKEPPSSVPCSKGVIGCSCRTDNCGGSGSFNAKTNDSSFVIYDSTGVPLRVYNNYSVRFDDDYVSGTMTFNVIGAQASLYFDTAYTDRNTTFLEAILLNGETFYGVYEVDVRNYNRDDDFISYLYVTKDKGVIAFEDYKNNKMYYRQDLD